MPTGSTTAFLCVSISNQAGDKAYTEQVSNFLGERIAGLWSGVFDRSVFNEIIILFHA
jgi:hypothetical protein